MKPLPSNLIYILPKIENAPRVVFFLDYDGTLTPIVDKPARAVLSPKTKFILKKLSEDKRIIVSIVSGRSLSQIRKFIGLKNIYYAGNHGLEIALGERSYIIPEAKKSLALIRSLKKALLRELKSIRSAEVEDKGIILAIHYRRVRKSLIPQIKKIFLEVTRPHLKSKKIRIAKGKKVLEIRPSVEWDKGKYCLYLLNRLKRKNKRILPVYIGDDVTDEDAFRVLRKKGVTIFVKGEKKTSSAEYYLDSSDEVNDFLTKVLSKK